MWDNGRMDITTMNTAKGSQLRYFNVAHDAVLWKLEGLDEYELRRPMTQTGTNLLGLTKHLALVEAGYFGETFGRPNIADMRSDTDTDTDTDAFGNADMYATLDETSEDIIGLFKRVWTSSQATIDELDLDYEGHVPWWGEAGNPVTLQRIMVHVTTEIYRHLGQMDIVRESIDGAAGMRQGADNMPELSAEDWAAYCQRLEAIADDAKRLTG